MSTIDSDGYVIESSNPDAEAVRDSVEGVASPSPATSVGGSAPVADASAEPETAEATERARAADGKFVKRNPIQERIDKAVGAQRAAERERDALRQELEAARAPKAQERPQEAREAPQPAQPTFDPAQGPQLDQYGSYEEWVDARAEWKAEQHYQRVSAAQQQEHALYSHTERIQSFAQQTPDYFDRIAEAARLPVSKAMERAIIDSARGPEIAYFLATHPEEGIRLAQGTVEVPLSQAHLVRELLESKLPASAASSGPAARGVRPSLPSPIKPVGAAPVVAETPPDTLEFGPEYVRRMNALEQQKHGRR